MSAIIVPGIALPATFPIMGVGVLSLVFLNIFQMMNVVDKRKAAGVKYPTLYASDAEAATDPKKKIFNCAQRAHANTLELIPTVILLYTFLGCFHPKIATGAVVGWALTRVSYTIGYSTGHTERRMSGLGRLGYPALIGGLLLPTLYVVATEVPKLFL